MTQNRYDILLISIPFTVIVISYNFHVISVPQTELKLEIAMQKPPSFFVYCEKCIFFTLSEYLLDNFWMIFYI